MKYAYNIQLKDQPFIPVANLVIYGNRTGEEYRKLNPEGSEREIFSRRALPKIVLLSLYNMAAFAVAFEGLESLF